MEVQDYIKHRMEHCSDYTSSQQDEELLAKSGIEEYVFRKLMSKRFRKWSLPESVQKQIREEVKYCVENQKPITLSLSYGGFKLWRLPTAPEVDWSMRTLIDMFTPHLPQNISIGASRLRNLFVDEDEFIKEGEKLRVGARQRFTNDPHLADEFRRGAIQNVQLIGGVKDLSKLSEKELRALRERAAEIIEALYGMPQITGQNQRGVVYLLATNMELDIPMIATGATKYSIAKFWAGLGVLAKDDDSYVEYVVTPKQWEQIKDKERNIIDTDLIPLKNFKEILVYPEKFSFAQ